MKHRCSAIRSLANLIVFKGMLFVHVPLLLSGLDIVSRISFLVQGHNGNDSSQA